MNTYKTAIRIARSLIEVTPHNFKHFSFLFKRNTVESVGWNKPNKTHPRSFRFGYRFNCIHSELDVINKFPNPLKEIGEYDLINIRLDRMGKVRLSKPCQICQHMLSVFSPKTITFSIDENEFGNL
jgi:hypothetical protein